ncbi:hypothetical protein [Cytobacillus firmus]|uniref:hypothetical protein n=1 Tax=Cytobacillus firmus TaxID=1399 RepID=UPI00202F24E8|nr:hypothetical protein [Cytobacillus firmus]URT71208.1 hypothetical protein NAF01_01570 [Cytobacillus firmus]
MNRRLNKTDFETLNISNIPSNKGKLLRLLETFGESEFTWSEISKLNLNIKLDISNSTFRKMINHSTMIGILNYNNRKYFLSDVSHSLLIQKFDVDEYFLQLLKINKQLFNNVKIILLLLRLFSGTLRVKTIYTIFSYIGKDRLDKSAEASVGRNIRAIFSIMIMMGLISRDTNAIHLKNKPKLINEFDLLNIQSIENKFNENIINVNRLTHYLGEFFDTEIVSKLLSCISTYETSNYIWSKSSLFKNSGEIKNIVGDYIMTVIIKRRM